MNIQSTLITKVSYFTIRKHGKSKTHTFKTFSSKETSLCIVIRTYIITNSITTYKIFHFSMYLENPHVLTRLVSEK